MARASGGELVERVLRVEAGALEAEDRERDEAAVHLEEGAPELAVDAGDGLGAAVLDEDVEDAALHLGVEDAHPVGLAAAAEDGAALAGRGELLRAPRASRRRCRPRRRSRRSRRWRSAPRRWAGALAAGAEEAAVAHQHEGAVGAGGDAAGVDAEAGGRGDGHRLAGDVEPGAGGGGAGAAAIVAGSQAARARRAASPAAAARSRQRSA